jgi:AcrR family transcriptional regulator
MSTVRERVRAQTIEEIKACALRQLATVGTDLSLRAIARELGLVSSAIYRYFAGRDELLTALIIDGYSDLADEVVTREGAVDRNRPGDRFAAIGHAVRDWALAHRAEYALLYGSPVPGYVAPEETIAPVMRMNTVLVDLLTTATERGTPFEPVALPTSLRHDITSMLGTLGRDGVDPERLARGFTAWASLFGVISFELFGHSVGITGDRDALFAVQLDGLVRVAGLA